MADSLDNPYANASVLSAALRAGELSAVQATEHYLAQIAAQNDTLGAFVAVTAESALAAAEQADAKFAKHHADPAACPLPPLHGVPIAHKDVLQVAGAPTTYGTGAMPATIATVDHPVVAQLRAAGTISLGKTQVPELGLNCYSENLVAPPARNPYDLQRTPGGSSGGSAAAVAAGLLPFAPGSDGGGSIRIPALACGLVGLKPGLGTVPGDVTEGTLDAYGGPRLVVHGPLARCAQDAALLMDALTGGQRHRNAVLESAHLRDLKIGVSAESPFAAAFPIALSAAATTAFDAAAQRLQKLGHSLAPGNFNYDPAYTEFFTWGWISGLPLLGIAANMVDQLTPLTQDFLARASVRSAAEHGEAARRLHVFATQVRAMWGEFDVVLTPGLAMDAPLVGEFMALPPAEDYQLQCQWTPYTSMVNVSGLPAISVPLTVSESGMPQGVQLIGRPGSEPQLLALAAQLMRD